MKKFFLILLLLTLAVPTYLLGSGTVDTTSLAMMLNVMAGRGIETPPDSLIETRLKVPEGFAINLYASDIPKARFMQFTATGDLLISRPHAGDILLLHRNPANGTVAGERVTLLQDLNRPSGLDIADGWLYVGETDAIGRVRIDEASGTLSGEYQHIITGLTQDGNHPYKVIGIGPDNKLYLSQGSTCNVCLEKDARRATLSRFNLDGSGEELFATGLRNSMGLDWAPWDGALYATDNGRDMLGDDYPPCELNKVEAGNFYGWPYYNGANKPDPDFGEAPPELAANPVAPVHEFRAHNAPLGLSFVDTNAWGESWDKVAMAALHGSWNRSSPDGYKVVSLHWDKGKITRRDFLSGFENGGDIIGRPVDVAQGPDGAIYISDDYAGAIYRVSHGNDAGGNTTMPVASARAFELEIPAWLTHKNSDELRQHGNTLFVKHDCGSCHNPATTTGNMKLDDVNKRLQYPELIDRLSNPTAPMPMIALDETEKRALAVYLLKDG
jgi:glucose/arabinose dehydrogenase